MSVVLACCCTVLLVAVVAAPQYCINGCRIFICVFFCKEGVLGQYCLSDTQMQHLRCVRGSVIPHSLACNGSICFFCF